MAGLSNGVKIVKCRDVAQPGRAQRSGRWGRWFKSSRPDHFASKLYLKFKHFIFKNPQTRVYYLNIIKFTFIICHIYVSTIFGRAA